MKTENDLKNKVAVITGASQGIGRASALALASEGINLVLVGRNQEKLSSLESECLKFGVKVKTVSFDLTQIEKMSELVSDVLNTFSKIDFLINNAGAFVRGNLDESALSEWDYLLNLNFRSVYHLTNRLLPSIQEGGAIINVSSISANHYNKGGEIYSATKAAMKAYSNCLFESIRERGIKVTSIYPGYVNTELGREDSLEPEKMIQPNDIAEAIKGVIRAPINVCSTEITIRPQFSPYRK